MEASDRRLCCGLESDKEGVNSHSEEVSLYICGLLSVPLSNALRTVSTSAP